MPLQHKKRCAADPGAAELQERFRAESRRAINETAQLGVAYELQSVRSQQLAKLEGRLAPRLKKPRWS